jgi:hypothetical protein
MSDCQISWDGSLPRGPTPSGDEHEGAVSAPATRVRASPATHAFDSQHYMERNSFVYIFEIGGPRTFGELRAQGHLKELVPELHKPTKKLDQKYEGQYDFYLDGKIRIEVKASRAVDANSDEPLYVKALTSDSKKNFWMNFQQVKCGCCDVFIWIAVWRQNSLFDSLFPRT